MIEKYKIGCENYRCNWRGMEGDELSAPDPFTEGATITACPKCRDIGTVFGVCDEAGCKKIATCGWPSPEGYRRTCGDHLPKDVAVIEPVPACSTEGQDVG